MKRPSAPDEIGHGYIDREQAGEIISEVRKTGRTILTEFESKKLLAAYGIPTVETHIALTENDAVKAGRAPRLSGRAEIVFRNHHAQDRRRRRAIEFAHGVGCPPGMEGD